LYIFKINSIEKKKNYKAIIKKYHKVTQNGHLLLNGTGPLSTLPQYLLFRQLGRPHS
jgi:hypothetical protein